MDKAKWKQLLGKKWAFPVIYMVAAVLILGGMWWYQDPNEYPLTKEDLGLEEVTPSPFVGEDPIPADQLNEGFGEAVPVSQTIEQMQWPVANINDIQVSMDFFDENATDEEMESAIVSFQDELWPHTGIDIVSANEKEFTVVAALGGEVVRAEKDPVVGYMVEVKHNSGVSTIYQSLSGLKVKKGDKVIQGATLGKANRNMFEKDQGIHLHFEVRKDDKAYNPYAFFDQELNQVLEELSDQENEDNE